MLKLRTATLLLVAVAGSAFALGPNTTLQIVSEEIAPDGFLRPATLANGIFPEFAINVVDLLNETSLDLGTSIHWHGIFQHHTNYVDGAASVTQCPLVPNESFLYQFNALNQSGTYWYHSHFSNQYCDGLRGALIIYDPDDPQSYLYDYDDADTVITLADWYHYLSTDAPLVPAFTSTLINGVGRYLGGPSNISLAVVNVQQGRRYRFRLLLFSIDGHQMTVIEVEGTNVQPVLVDGVSVFAGQRYSVVVTANQPVANTVWVRALPAAVGVVTFDNFTNVAVLRYAGAPNANPPGDPSVNVPVLQLPLNETDLHPGQPFPGGADININLNVVIVRTNDNRTAFLVNGVIFEPPTVPVLLQILSGAKNASQLLPARSIYGLDANKSVELTIPGGAVGGPHPVHLHGHAFSVVRSAGNSTYNFDNPVIRDVVSIGNTGDNVTIRFFTDNPGPCGFAVVFAEDVPDVPQQDFVDSTLTDFRS
ncbi:Cupredoxin [Russula vinacea]|nr:Cupredoxin [Russula vinacea]